MPQGSSSPLPVPGQSCISSCRHPPSRDGSRGRSSAILVGLASIVSRNLSWSESAAQEGVNTTTHPKSAPCLALNVFCMCLVYSQGPVPVLLSTPAALCSSCCSMLLSCCHWQKALLSALQGSHLMRCSCCKNALPTPLDRTCFFRCSHC